MSISQSPKVIRITSEEAGSSHVDDMLQRQRNMRGDSGMRRHEAKNWFYQNWFVFMVVCALGALLGWAVVEPYMHDMCYFQGEISDLKWYPENQYREVKLPLSHETVPLIGELTVGGDHLYLVPGVVSYEKGIVSPVVGDVAVLANGQTLGLYAQDTTLVDSDAGVSGLGSSARMTVFMIDRQPAPLDAAHPPLDVATYRRQGKVIGFTFFALIAGAIGLFLGATDGLICRQPRRALLCGSVGLVIGLLGGFVSNFMANLVFGPLAMLAARTEGAGGMAIMVAARALAWIIAGAAMGLGQGIALRSKKLVLYGFIGGVLGGLVGGLVFDPIGWLQENPTTAATSRMIGITIVGASVGLMIGLVELLVRDAWLRMTRGPLAGKEFLVFKDIMYIGASPRSDIYLFNDCEVADTHAAIRSSGDHCEIEETNPEFPVRVNNNTVKRARLRAGDQITIGQTMFTFQERKR
jgi:MFS family permease